MAEFTVVATVPSKVVHIGGEQHSGWLPAHASTPNDMPLQEVQLSFELQFDGSGYLLCYSTKDGSVYGDTWHMSQAEAEQVAKEEFGVNPWEWQRMPIRSFQPTAFSGG